MKNSAPFYVTVGERRCEVRPATVRERMRLANLLIENERNKALETARLCELSGREFAAFVAERVAEAEKMSAVVMWCFTVEGAMAVLYSCCSREDADEIGTLEPGEVGAIAARALNVNVGRADQETATSGKP
jgi:hypothetical protein